MPGIVGPPPAQPPRIPIQSQSVLMAETLFLWHCRQQVAGRGCAGAIMLKIFKSLAVFLGLLLGLGVALLVGMIFLARQGHGPCLPDVIEQEAVSPDKRWVARMGVCGGLAGSFYYFDMARPGFTGDPEIAQSFEIVGAERPLMRWVDAQTLEISLPPRMQPGAELQKYKGIALRYTHRN